VGVISKFEGMMETVVEGSFTRLFRSRIQPAEILKRLERLMEDTKEVALGKSYVPNRYEVYLNPEDFSQFEPHKTNLERDMSGHVLNYGQQRHFIFSGGRPRVWLNSSDQVRRRGFTLKAYTVDPNQPQFSAKQPPAPAAPDAIPEGTSILNVGALPLTGSQKVGGGSTAFARPEATLTVVHYPSNHPAKNIMFKRDVTIGRSLSNEVVFSDEPRVSGHHAKIEFKYGQFLFTDLNSTNGSSVNGQPVTQIILTPNDRISLGGLELIFQVN
jgi:hypothetical protein